MKLEEIRREYLAGGLRRKDLCTDPLEQFQQWMKHALKVEGFDATAMTVATVDEAGRPSQRTVLLKHVDQQGLVFYTNLSSKKARDLEQNSAISLHFAWLPLERQVKIYGHASRLPTTTAIEYFLSRPRQSQLAAWASHQSRRLSSRQMLENAFEQMKQKFRGGKIPLPDFWGGFLVRPESIEFWQGGAKRMHDRFEYRRDDDGNWSIERLAP